MKFGDSAFNAGRIILLVAYRVLCTCIQYSIALCRRPEVASRIISAVCMWPTINHKVEKCGDPRLSRSGEIRLKAVGCSIFGRFSNFDKCRPETAGDVISSVALAFVGLDVRAKLRDSRLNNGIILFDCWVGRTRFRTFEQYFITFCSRPETISNVISGVIVEAAGMKVHVKLGDSRSNRSRYIRLPQIRDELRRNRNTPIIT